MLKPKITSHTRTTRRHEMSLSRESLIKALQVCGVEVPKDASVTFTVPGGGDWSNCTIDVDREHPINIEWTVVEDT